MIYGIIGIIALALCMFFSSAFGMCLEMASQEVGRRKSDLFNRATREFFLAVLSFAIGVVLLWVKP